MRDLTNVKPSDLILEGAKDMMQVEGALHTWDYSASLHEPTECVCVVGALLNAAYSDVNVLERWDNGYARADAVAARYGSPLIRTPSGAVETFTNACIVMNDREHLTFEQIVEVLRSQGY